MAVGVAGFPSAHRCGVRQIGNGELEIASSTPRQVGELSLFRVRAASVGDCARCGLCGGECSCFRTAPCREPFAAWRKRGCSPLKPIHNTAPQSPSPTLPPRHIPPQPPHPHKPIPTITAPQRPPPSSQAPALLQYPHNLSHVHLCPSHAYLTAAPRRALSANPLSVRLSLDDLPPHLRLYRPCNLPSCGSHSTFPRQLVGIPIRLPA